AAPTSLEIRELCRAQGARRAVSAGRARLCLEQSRPEVADLDRMARPHRRFDRPGGGCLFPPAPGGKRAKKRPELTGLWPFSLSFNIKQSDLVRRTERGRRGRAAGENLARGELGRLAGLIGRSRSCGGSGQGTFGMRLLLRFFGLLFAAGTIIFIV